MGPPNLIRGCSGTVAGARSRDTCRSTRLECLTSLSSCIDSERVERTMMYFCFEYFAICFGVAGKIMSTLRLPLALQPQPDIYTEMQAFWTAALASSTLLAGGALQYEFPCRTKSHPFSYALIELWPPNQGVWMAFLIPNLVIDIILELCCAVCCRCHSLKGRKSQVKVGLGGQHNSMSFPFRVSAHQGSPSFFVKA